jgi:hypothetical protein
VVVLTFGEKSPELYLDGPGRGPNHASGDSGMNSVGGVQGSSSINKEEQVLLRNARIAELLKQRPGELEE